MKTNFYIIILTILSLGIVSAQTSTKDIRNEIVDTELLKNWNTGQTKTIKDQIITKTVDNGDGSTRTNLMYSLPSHNLFMHSTLMVMPIAVPKSGTLYIMVDRAKEADVNASNYTITVYDNSGKIELYTATPENTPGKEYKYGIWYNQFGIDIPVIAGSAFNVKVTDNTTGKSVSYHVESNVADSNKTTAER